MRPLAGASIENLRQVFGYGRGLVSREHVLSLVDQAVVSGTSFVTTLLIARGSGSSRLGIYALGMSLLLSFVAFKDFAHFATLFDQEALSGGNGRRARWRNSRCSAFCSRRGAFWC